jgi:D-beta-D-heptose 7-phosphate kinase/D-beta-D-heptose 1-phosphate adenosyltransferase
MNTDRPRILVAGDVMRDHRYFCEANRVAPEAPNCIVNKALRTWDGIGGAGNVALMARALGAEVTIAGVIGKDADGAGLHEDFETAGITPVLCWERERVTTQKIRVHTDTDAGWVQTARIDCESDWSIAEETAAAVIEQLCGSAGIATTFDMILVSDYGKGFLTSRIRHALKKSGVPMIVDPTGQGPWPQWIEAAACMIPNRHACIGDVRWLVDTHKLRAGVITKDADGLTFLADGVHASVSSTAHQVVDSMGASDQFLAALGVAVARGMPWIDAIRVANNAAGLQVEQFGCEPIDPATFGFWDEMREAA